MESQVSDESNRQIKAAIPALPSEFIERALLLLPKRSKDVIVKRFNLNGEGDRTLEEIGRMFKITRERVRQIERGAMAKIKEANGKDISEYDSFFQNIINKNGGVLEHDFFLEKIMDHIENIRAEKVKDRGKEKRNLILIIFLVGAIKHKLKNKKNKNIFYLKEESVKTASAVLEEAIRFFEEEKKAMVFSDIFSKLKERAVFKEKNIDLSQEALYSYLMLSEEIGADPRGQWGLASWPFIFPRSVRDKAYLVLLYKKEPLHFKKIAQLADETWTRKKKPALAETVHNELIKDKRFVLVGRGIYALAEWGYERGTVQDIIKNVLVKKGSPMEREDIIKEVSAQRMVKPSTIVLNLKNKEIFTLLPDGTYAIKN